MEVILTQKIPKKYECKCCDYSTSNKKDYDKHLLTSKHKKMVGGSNLEEMEVDKKLEYNCDECSKKFKTHGGLWKHKQKCSIEKTTSAKISVSDNSQKNEVQELKEFMKYLMKENLDMKTMMMEQQNIVLEIAKNGTHNTTNNHTNSHNKAFNLQFFLNETCKDAMNITDFVESIQLQLSDLEKVGEIGYVEGISNIIVKNLNALDVTQRPVHCTDKKRETIYIKDEDKWEKDEEKNKIRKVIKKVATKNARLIQKFKDKHPDYNEYHSKYSTQYHKLIIESLGGPGDNDLEKEDKIIRNIAKNIVVEK
jgi:Txe/YoeB family toxin of Txe-Axe toxin-antitoxin module